MKLQEIHCPECGARFWIGQDQSADFEPLTRCAACGAGIPDSYDCEDDRLMGSFFFDIGDWNDDSDEDPDEEEEWDAWNDGGLFDRRPTDSAGGTFDHGRSDDGGMP